MRLSLALNVASVFLFMSLITLCSAKKSGDVTELQIGVKYKPKTCEVQAHKGDNVKVHYRGKLTDGTVFDSSFERGDPIEFELGSGQVIKGWDQGLLGMCLGEKRKLKIPAKLGYGDQGSPPTIPGGATLIFDTELVGVNGKTMNDGKSDDTTGWDQGLLGMCLGEKRKLKIPAKLGYGDQGSPPTIPGGATLIFDTELVGVNGKTMNDGKSDDTTGDSEL